MDKLMKGIMYYITAHVFMPLFMQTRQQKKGRERERERTEVGTGVE